MNKKYLIVGHMPESVLLGLLSKTAIAVEDVLIVNPQDPNAEEQIKGFHAQTNIKPIELKFEARSIELPKMEYKQVKHIDYHPHIPNHVKKNWRRRH